MHISTRRLVAAAAVSLAAAALTAPVAASAAPSPSRPATHIGGVIPSRDAGRTSPTTGGNLINHGGPVMTTNNVYLIYWVPPGYSVDGNYEKLINQFFTDVAADNGKSTNVYAIDTQYSVAYQSKLAGFTVDTSSLPSSGCRDKYTSVCLTDSQIQNEINRVRGTNWPTGQDNLFVMLTANGIGSCSGRSCAFSQYCAYHGDNTTTGLYYANMPYADTVSSACDTGVSPNGDHPADAEINILSHEHNEAITDEQLNAWYDSQGSEIGDKCAWNFGTALGTTAYGAYNQVINTHDYYLQQEWSNASTNCALTYP